MLKRIVDGTQIIALVLVLATVVMLFRGSPKPSATVRTDSLGAQVYENSCARCHGADGSGGIGPSLISGEVFERFPDRLSTIEFVSNGEGLMPAFGTRLTVGEIGAVIDFVRKELATQG